MGDAMRRWNGWGDEATEVELPAHGEAFLAELAAHATEHGYPANWRPA